MSVKLAIERESRERNLKHRYADWDGRKEDGVPNSFFGFLTQHRANSRLSLRERTLFDSHACCAQPALFVHSRRERRRSWRQLFFSFLTRITPIVAFRSAKGRFSTRTLVVRNLRFSSIRGEKGDDRGGNYSLVF
jgi:hypothetical protein